MHRSQIYLSESHLGNLAAYAKARATTHSALIREALDEYLARQAPLDKRAIRAQSFAAWGPASESETASLGQLRAEERFNFERNE